MFNFRFVVRAWFQLCHGIRARFQSCPSCQSAVSVLRSRQGTALVYGAMTSVTGVAKTSFTLGLGFFGLRGSKTMPSKRMHANEQRMQFVIRATSGQERMAALCREFGIISRPTGYRWRGRYQQRHRLTQLAERSRRPHHSPRQTETWKQQRVVALRQETG